ncbi:MAG: hypothetical protein ACOYLB_00985 [Phototrophicaceae bacterium]
MMKRVSLFYYLIVCLTFLISSCAPSDLDMTPLPTETPVPTEIPVTSTPAITLTEAVSSTEEVSSLSISNDDLVNLIVASSPDRIPAGAVEWIVDRAKGAESVRNVEGGIAKKIFISERGGGKASLTFGVFDSEDAAKAYYDFIKGLRASLEFGEPRANFPENNLFGSGLYGSNAIVQENNLFIEVSVEAFSSTSGDPLTGLTRATLSIMTDGVALSSTQSTEQAPILVDIEEMMPDTLEAGGTWTKIETLPVLVENGSAIEIVYRQNTENINIYFGTFNAPSDTLVAYQNLLSRGTIGTQLNTELIAVKSSSAQMGILVEVLKAVQPIFETP